MSVDSTHASSPSDPEAAASAWLARRDRGLTAAEQDEYLQWLRQDPRHGQAIGRLDRTWSALDALAEWRPAHSPRPNPDLLAQPRRRGRRFFFSLAAAVFAAAAVVAVGLFVLRPKTILTPPSTPAVRVIPGPERLVLADGSVVELDHGGKIETTFTAAERRVRLVRGEALFTVAKNPARPFIVAAGPVAVRAVGTVFDVRRGTGAIEVLVTEGRVQLERPAGASTTPLQAGQHARVDTTAADLPVVVHAVDPGEIERSLAWQGVLLKFADLPLSEVLAEFNLRNRQQVVIGDPAVAGVLVGGSFRADNVEGFLRLLEVSFGVSAERRDDGTIVLHRAR